MAIAWLPGPAGTRRRVAKLSVEDKNPPSGSVGGFSNDLVYDRGDVALTTALNVEEVVRGLHPDEEAAAGVLFDGLGIVPLGRSEGRQAGEWRRTFARRGVTLSQADCLIAAAAQAVAAVLATGNPAHFPMSDVTLEHWPVGR